jgi:hypothetical protein
LLPANTFADLAFDALEAITDDDARIRRVGAIKPFLEEILPLAIFARYFDMPEKRVHCRYLGESNEADAEIVLSGRAVDRSFYPEKIWVEITCAEDGGKAYLRREVLAREGAVFAGGNIERTASRHKKGSTVVSKPEVRDAEAAPRNLGALVRAAIERKISKNYDPKRLLLVRIDPDFPLSPSELCVVVKESQAVSSFQGLSGVFLVECSTGSVIQAV